MAIREIIVQRNGTRKFSRGWKRFLEEKQLRGDKQEKLIRRLHLTAIPPRYREPYNIYAFDGERINISRTASPLTPKRLPPLRPPLISYITHIPLYTDRYIKAEKSNAKYYYFPRPYPIKWKSSIWIFMNI